MSDKQSLPVCFSDLATMKLSTPSSTAPTCLRLCRSGGNVTVLPHFMHASHLVSSFRSFLTHVDLCSLPLSLSLSICRVSDLLDRVKQLETWSADLTLVPSLWISGLFNPMSFLTAIMQVCTL